MSQPSGGGDTALAASPPIAPGLPQGMSVSCGVQVPGGADGSGLQGQKAQLCLSGAHSPWGTATTLPGGSGVGLGAEEGHGACS